MSASPRERFLSLLTDAVQGGNLVKLTLAKPSATALDPTVQKLLVRPVTLKAGPHLTFVWRHATRDITKNHAPAEALQLIEPLLGSVFLDAHLFTPMQTAQLETKEDGSYRLRVKSADVAPPAALEGHDRKKTRVIDPESPWLQALGVTNERGQPREGMAGKFRQIEKFAELLSGLCADAGLTSTDIAHLAPQARSSADASNEPAESAESSRPLRIVDMGCGKGYLTFAIASLFGSRAIVRGIESRNELVALCNRVASEQGFSKLTFEQGEIASAAMSEMESLDVLIALHACDTATDDALARGISSGAKLLVVSPCCQKELRPQLTAPPILSEALRHGIFQERQSEFVTDALRAQLLEWAGYRTKVFEFISTEHTAKNLMITAIRERTPRDPAKLDRIRAFAAFYGVRSHRLAQHLEVQLSTDLAAHV